MGDDPADGSTSCGIGLSEAEPLIDALRDPSSETRLAVLEALTSLPLDRDSWSRVREYAIWALEDESAPEHLEAMQFAARVPIRAVRSLLWRLAETGEPDERGRAALALAAVDDDHAIQPLLSLLAEPAVRLEAAQHLALLSVAAATDSLRSHCAALRGDPERDETRFWLALALARAGDDSELHRFLSDVADGRAEFQRLWGDPAILLADLRRGPALPASVQDRLQGEAERLSDEGGRLATLLLEAEDDGQMSPSAPAGPAGPPLQASAEDAERVRSAVGRLGISVGDQEPASWRPEIERLIEELSDGGDRRMIASLVVLELFRSVGTVSFVQGNAIVQLVHDLGDSYAPDPAGLLDVYLPHATGRWRSYLGAQAAWAASRSGLAHLLAGVRPALADGGERRLAAARLIAEAAAYASWTWPPLFGGAPAGPEPPPPLELIDDMHAGNGGGEEAEPVTRGLPKPAQAPAEAAPAPPTRGLPKNGEPQETAPIPAETRSILVQVSDLHDAAQPTVVEQAFRAGAPHQLTVRVGSVETGWISPAAGPSFDEALGPVEGSQPLTVTFLAGSGALPQQAVIFLPPSGPSTACTFAFQPEPDSSSFEAQIHVFHRNRLVQLALLRGSVYDDPAGAPADTRIELELAVIVPGGAPLESRDRFDAAVARTGARMGATATAGVADDRLVVFDDDRIEQSIPALTSTLKDLATSDAARRGDLTDADSVEHLRELAFQGRELYDVIGKPIAERLAGPEQALERLQVLVESAADFFPVELVYDLPPPADDATLCPGWKTALLDGRCPEAHDPAGPRGLSPTVCPSGFWATSKVIERQVLGDESWASADLRGAEFAVRAALGAGRNALRPPEVALFAASDRVDLVKPGGIASVRKALDRAAPGSAYVDTWDDWVLGVERLSPTLLVLLSHTTEIGSSPALEIGAEQRCRISQLLPEYVRVSEDDRPIVLLLGCETAVSDFGLQTFVARFQDLGAAIVVGTVASVLGQRATAVAQTLTSELTKAGRGKRPVRAGDLLRDVRRRLLAKGELTALCLTSFGDADWELGGN